MTGRTRRRRRRLSSAVIATATATILCLAPSNTAGFTYPVAIAIVGRKRGPPSSTSKSTSIRRQQQALPSSVTTVSDVMSMLPNVLNPKTGRMIRQRPIDDFTNKVNGGKWYEFMCLEGGYIATADGGTLNDGCMSMQLTPLNLASLAQWNVADSNKDSDKRGEELAANGSKGNQEQTAPSPTSEECCVITPEIQILHEYHRMTETLSQVKEEDVSLLSDLLFVYKPPSLLTLPGIGADKADCLASRVNAWLVGTEEGQERMATIGTERRDNKTKTKHTKKSKSRNDRKGKGPYVPRPCHRLDYDTSGVIVVALSPEAQRCGQMAFQERWTDKEYVALVAGHLSDDDGAIDYGIGKVPVPGEGYNKWACAIPGVDVDDGFVEGSVRSARTEWKVSARLTVPLLDVNTGVRSEAKYTRVRLKPITGRGHQLRLHMAAIGHPILGDQLHAPQEISDTTPRLCLHAETIIMPIFCEKYDGVALASASFPAPF